MDERSTRGGGGFAPRRDGDGERERSRAAVRRGRVRARVPEEWGVRAPDLRQFKPGPTLTGSSRRCGKG